MSRPVPSATSNSFPVRTFSMRPRNFGRALDPSEVIRRSLALGGRTRENLDEARARSPGYVRATKPHRPPTARQSVSDLPERRLLRARKLSRNGAPDGTPNDGRFEEEPRGTLRTASGVVDSARRPVCAGEARRSTGHGRRTLPRNVWNSLFIGLSPVLDPCELLFAASNRS